MVGRFSFFSVTDLDLILSLFLCLSLLPLSLFEICYQPGSTLIQIKILQNQMGFTG